MIQNYSIVAFEFPPYKGGIANYSYTLIKNLVNQGNNVTVYTINSKASEIGCPLHKPSWNYNPEKWWFPIKKMLSFLFRLYQLAFYRFILKSIVEEYERCNTRIIITTLFYDLSRKLTEDLNVRGIEYALVLHGLDIFELPSKYPRSFELSIQGANLLIFNSNQTKKLFEGQFSFVKRKSIVHPMIDSKEIFSNNLKSRQELEKAFGIEPNQKWVISICRLVNRKGIDRVISAITEILNQDQSISYLIVGNGEEEENLRSIVPNELQNRIRFLGQVTDQEKFSLLYLSEVFAMPNRGANSDVEGFGISFLEASLMRNWVIGGNSGGVPEAINTELNGYLVNDDDSLDVIKSSLINAMNRTDFEKLDMAKEWVLDNFDVNRCDLVL